MNQVGVNALRLAHEPNSRRDLAQDGPASVSEASTSEEQAALNRAAKLFGSIVKWLRTHNAPNPRPCLWLVVDTKPQGQSRPSVGLRDLTLRLQVMPMLAEHNDAPKVESDRWVEIVYDAIGQVLDTYSYPPFPEFHSLALQTIASARQRYDVKANGIPWLAFPLAVAKTVKAPATAAAKVGAGFELARMAAGILDQCIDQDTDGALWTKIGMGPTITLANGLTCLSLLAIGQLSECDVSGETASRIRTEFELTWLQMCHAQQKELAILRGDEVSEKTYWDIARGKSGCFFELGCKAAAMLAPNITPEMLNGYAGYGHNIGVMLQLINDLRGLWGVEGKKDIGQRMTLPIISHAQRYRILNDPCLTSC